VIEAQLDLKSAPVIFNNSCLSWVSVGRAFLRAGARGYVGTLWSVASAEAARLAQQMLAQLTRGETLGRALAASQIDDELTRRAYIYVGAANATLGAGILTAEQRAGLWSALEVLSRELRALSDAGHPDAARVLYRKFRELGESFIALAQRPEYAIPSEQVIDYYLEDAYYLVKTATQRGAPRTIWEDARERLEAALAQLDALQIPAEDALPRRALAWGRLGYIERTRGDLDRALEHYRASRDALLQLNDARRAAKCESQIAYIQWMRGDEHAAEEEYAKSFQLRAGLNDPREMLEIYSQRAAFWVDRGRYADALGAFQRAEELNRVVQDRYYQAHNLLNLGKMFVELGEGDKAETCFDDSQKLFDELKDTAGMYELAYARGSVMAKQNRWLDAQNYFTVALEFARTLQTEQPTADALYMLGVAHHAQGHLADAVDCYRQSLALVTALGNPSAELATRLDLARAYAAQNQSALARDEYARALEIARAVNDAAAGDIHNELVGLPM
jgi:tetratricopeptide (TPR) repeat protein